MRLWSTQSQQTTPEAYIQTHTKKCPNRRVPIEKNGGCEHMTCRCCHHEFCWHCGRPWYRHPPTCEVYEEGFYAFNESLEAERRRLEEYSRYLDRFNAQARALRLTDGLRERIRHVVNERVAAKEGTRAGWQYLFNAVDVLHKCRSTLLYSYPDAYFLDSGSQRLFVFHQENLAAEIESLSGKLKITEATWREDIVSQLALAEKHRALLLEEWSKT